MESVQGMYDPTFQLYSQDEEAIRDYVQPQES